MKKTLTIFTILLLSFNFVHASDNTIKEKLAQQIEILRWEVQVLQSLIANLRSTKQITAQSYLAINLLDNTVLLEKNPSQIYSIASITKLMSVLVAVENIDLNEKIILSNEMLKPIGHSPTLFSGLSINAQSLLRASLIQSVNDASESLSFYLGKQTFINLMNKKAQELEMTNTVFYDSHGLNPSNKSNSNDLVKLLAYIYKNHPEILNITKDNNFWLPDQSGKLFKFRNINNFYYFASFIGGKTGYLPEAKQTMATVFEINNQPIGIIVLYSQNHQSDIIQILKQIK